jgi:hypothetical protein
MNRLALCSASIALFSTPVLAAVDFEKDVKPILESTASAATIQKAPTSSMEDRP